MRKSPGCSIRPASALFPRVLFLLVWPVVLFLAPPIVAQTQAGEPDAIQIAGVLYYKVEGRLVMGGKQQPLIGIQMQLIGMKGAPVSSSITDRDGQFAFYRIREDSYTIVFSPPGAGQRALPLEVWGGPVRGIIIDVSEMNPARRAPPGGTVTVWASRVPEAAQKAYSDGMKALLEKKHKQALELLQKATTIYPEHAAAHAARGSIFLTENQQAQAAAAFERALEIDPNLPDACLGLGAIYSKQKRYADAEKQLIRARLMKPQDWRVHFELGETYLAADDLTKAEDSLRQALRLHADFPRTHLLFINALALQEKLPETLMAMDEYLKGFPQDSFAAQVQKKRDLLKAQLRPASPASPPHR